MFKSISIIQNLRKTTRILNNSTTRCSINLSNQNKKINLKEQSNESTSLRTKDLDDLKNSFKRCRSVNELFYLIKPNITKFKNDELAIVFKAIDHLYHQSKYYRNISSLNEFSRDLQNSNVYKLLLDHSNQQIKQLDDLGLRNLMKLFFLANQHPQSAIVKSTFIEIDSRLPNLELIEILNYITDLGKYLFANASRINEYYEFYKTLLQIAKGKILNDEFDLNDQFINNFYSAFLKPDNDLNHEIVNHLTKKLLSPDCKFDFLLSTKLLKKIMQNYILYLKDRKKKSAIQHEELRYIYCEIELRFKEERLFPKILNDLIDKANEKIYEHFSITQSKRDLDYFLKKIHFSSNALNYELPNFYSGKLLIHLVSHLIENLKSDENYQLLTLHLIQNYAKYNIYDERLMKLVYFDIFCAADNSRQFKRITIKDLRFLYLFLSKYRLPYVDQQKLAIIICNLSVFKSNPVVFLIEFILNDVDNEDLYKRLIKEINNLNANDFDLNEVIFRRIPIAKHLIEKANLDKKMKFIINQILNQLANSSKNQKKLIYSDFYNIDKRMQKNACLSNNNIEINEFCIYDKNKEDLISLTQYRDLLLNVEQIELENENQEM